MTTLGAPLRVLIIEDSEDDALLLLRELRRGGYEPSSSRVETLEDMRSALQKPGWDIVLSDYIMPKFSGVAALSFLKETGLDLPFIIVSGNIGEDIAVEAMRSGAHDYIIKGNLARLVPAVERELREAENRRERREAERYIIATNEILTLFPPTIVRQEYLDKLVVFLGKWSGCECIGFRVLGEDGSIPYGASSGFDTEFIKEENCLSLKKDQCVCPRIMSEIPDRSELPFVTASGSFLCNDTAGLFNPEGPDKGAIYKQGCSRQGFLTVAVIPVRYRGSVLGAIHLADRQMGKIPPGRIKLIEALTHLIGEALSRFGIEESLMKSREQFRALSAHLQEAIEDERIKVAREIHDELGQILTAARIEMAGIEKEYSNDENILEKIDSVSELVDIAIEDVHRICAELRPRVLDHLGLVAAIEWHAAEFSKRSGIACTLNIPQDKTEVPAAVSTAMFRILQEALTNVARHAGATQVNVHMAVDDSAVFLEIRDNGTGIPNEKIVCNKSYGVMGIQERAHELGGTATFRGITNKGTTITVKVPIKTIGGSDV